MSRYILVCAAAVAMFVASNDSVFLAWGVTYLATTFIFYRTILAATPQNAQDLYPVIFAMNCVKAAVFSAAPVWIWITSDDIALRALSICGVIGLGMFNLKRHRRWSAIALFDCTWTVVIWAAITMASLTYIDATISAVLIGLGALTICGYYVLAQAHAINDRTALTRNRETALRAQKISAIDQVTAGVAHDFNNMLTAIQGNIELAELSRDPLERAEFLAQAKASSRDASKVVAQMRAYVGKSRMRPQTICLSEFMPLFRANMRAAMTSSVRFELTVRPHDLEIYCDETLLETALINLVENAQEAMGPEGGILWLRVGPCQGLQRPGRESLFETGFVQFSLQDTGPGILEDHLPRVTDPFYSTKPAGNGSGLGLSMVNGFAEQSGGALVLNNLVKGGFEATLILPANAG